MKQVLLNFWLIVLWFMTLPLIIILEMLKKKKVRKMLEIIIIAEIIMISLYLINN